MCDDTAALTAQIASLDNLITLYLAALTALVNDGVKSYTLNTGQTVQTVTALDIGSLQDKLNSAYNLKDVLCARLNRGSGGTQMVPFC
jgi:hypothetical protein